MAYRVSLNRFFQPSFSPGLAWEPEPDVLAFHRALPGYAPTPLVALPGLARELGVGAIWVKDESQRFGLNAFKVLGASYAIYRVLRRQWESEPTPRAPGERFEPERFVAPEFTWRLRPQIFATATDGNHGRAVAWTARLLGQRAVIYVPRNTVPARIEAIRGEGAEVIVVDGTYDEAVQRAARDAQERGWTLISDTAYEGYTEIPRWIMEGYSTLFVEADAQLASARGAAGGEELSSVVLQAGVGGLACAGALHYRRKANATSPRLISVEPLDADCLLESSLSEDGGLRAAHGAQNSIMAGLNCGTPSLLAWPILREAVSAFLAIDDEDAREAMRRLHAPFAGDPTIISGESGCVGLAGLRALCLDPALAQAREQLGLDAESEVLLINTEGDTDPANYRAIVSPPP